MATTVELSSKEQRACDETGKDHVWFDDEWEDGEGGQYWEQYCKNCYASRDFGAIGVNTSEEHS